MARRSTRARFIRPPARTKMWIGSGVGGTVLAGNTLALVSTLSGGALLLRPFTIMRTRMDLLFHSDQQAADETPHGSYGKLVVTDTAAALGVTALPNPSGINGDPEAAWFVWQAMSSAFLSSTEIGGEGWHYVIDSKSMRKVGPDDDVVTLVDMQDGAGANLVSNGRMLIQLH